MPYYEKREGFEEVRTEKLFVMNEQGQEVPITFQGTYDVLKDLNLDQYVSDEERKFLQIQ
jgi:hypothetical protein